MKNTLDDKLQELLKDKTPGRNEELSLQERQALKAYQQLVDILDNEPGPKVPLGFSTKVMGVIQKKKDRKQAFILYSLFTLIVLPATYFCMSLINDQVARQFADVFIQYRWLFIFSVAIILMIHFADKKFVSNMALSQ